MLDAGLSVLSLTTGPVLGAFLVGVLTERPNAAAMIVGMTLGAIVLIAVWWTGAVAWTWFALLGAAYGESPPGEADWGRERGHAQLGGATRG